MSFSHGDGDEMGNKDHGISADEADQLLSGRTPAGRDDLAALATDLAALSTAFVHEVDPGLVHHWAAEAASRTHLIPSEKGDLAATSASNAYGPALQVSGLPKRRTSVIKSMLALLATTGGKIVAATAVAAASTTGGLAVTGNLPGQSDTPDPVTTIDQGELEPEDDVLEDEAHDTTEVGDDAVEECDDHAEDADDLGDDEADESDEAVDADRSEEAACEPVVPEVVTPDVEAPEVDDDADEADDDGSIEDHAEDADDDGADDDSDDEDEVEIDDDSDADAPDDDAEGAGDESDDESDDAEAHEED
jgi:hypothetical protein